MLRSLLLVLSLSLVVATHRAQAQTVVTPGARVWVRTVDEFGRLSRGIKGTVTQVEGDTLYIDRSAGSGAVAVYLQAKTQVWLSNGRRSSAGRGALIGFGIGAVGGALLGAATACQGSNCWFGPEVEMAAGALVFGVGGLISGAVIGAVVKHEVWVPTKQQLAIHPVVQPYERSWRLGAGFSF